MKYLLANFAYHLGAYATALRLFKSLADQGHINAQAKLGGIYYSGRGVTRDYGVAVKWYRRAAERGHAGAQFYLGWMCKNGEGVPQDEGEAVKWYWRAAEQGQTQARNNLGGMYGLGGGMSQNLAETEKRSRRAAEQKLASAQYVLGRFHDKGLLGMPRDHTEAMKCYRRAAEQGHAEAQFAIGLAYENGKGVPQNDAEAAKWYWQASEQGLNQAKKRLDVLATRLDENWGRALSNRTSYILIAVSSVVLVMPIWAFNYGPLQSMVYDHFFVTVAILFFAPVVPCMVAARLRGHKDMPWELISVSVLFGMMGGGVLTLLGKIFGLF